MTTKTRMTLEEFLALPEEKPYLEFVDGEVVPKPMPNEDHGALVIEIGGRLRNYLRESKEGRVVTEVRHLEREEERVFLPDVSVTRKERRPAGKQNPVEVMPDLAIEVLSPDDRPGRVMARIGFYQRHGVPLVWVVDPADATVTVFRQGEPPAVLGNDDTLNAQPVLEGFELPVGDLFAVLADD